MVLLSTEIEAAMGVDGARRQRLRARSLDAWSFMMGSFGKRMKAADLLGIALELMSDIG
jgi:hypothetical protein